MNALEEYLGDVLKAPLTGRVLLCGSVFGSCFGSRWDATPIFSVYAYCLQAGRFQFHDHCLTIPRIAERHLFWSCIFE